MLDYLLAIFAALAAVVVMFFTFNSVSAPDASVVEVKSEKKNKKSNKPSKKEEEALDKEAEELLNQEIARGRQGMGTDTDDIRPQTWEQIQNSRNNRMEAKRAQNTVKTVSERQKLIDRELGFQQVNKAEPKSKADNATKKTEKSAESNEVVERLLQQFFKNNSSNGRNKAHQPPAEKTENKGAGGRVTVKGEVSNKSW